VLEELNPYPCPRYSFSCFSITQPLDNFNESDERTIDIVFTVLPATGNRLGTFAIIVGGPGGSGVASASYYFEVMSRFDPRLNEHYDIVMVDPRGIGLSAGGYNIDCPNTVFPSIVNQIGVMTEEDKQTMVSQIQQFTESCLQDIDQSVLPFFTTSQAVADLEAIFETFGLDKVWLYGESYGTQVVQRYATTYPDRVAGVILDGVVDLTLSGPEYYMKSVAYQDALKRRYLEACNADAQCANDFGGDAILALERLHEQLENAPVMVDFPLPNGQFESREFTREDLFVATGFLSTGVLRALAAAVQGDFVPLLRYRYLAWQENAQTNDVFPMNTDVLIRDNVGYFMVDCSDYAFFEGTPEERAQAFVDAADALAIQFPLTTPRAMYTNLVCAFWPVSGSNERPTPFTGSNNYVTFILNGTDDLATPTSNGYDVFERVKTAFMITRRGGDHVIFGRGDACPDNIIMDYLVYSILPEEREILCTPRTAFDYEPVMRDIPENITAEGLMELIVTEIVHMPESLLGVNTLVGCPQGGVMSITPQLQGVSLSFADCGILGDVRITGTGMNDLFQATTGTLGNFRLDVFLAGSYEGYITYIHDYVNGILTWDGQINGQDTQVVP
jgi:pimeloyl-ACP methyl ester carboxylesterase